MSNGNGHDNTIAPKYLCVRDASLYSGIGKWQIRYLARENRLISVKPFGRRLISKEDLDRIIRLPAE
jgi:hypothetical protein